MASSACRSGIWMVRLRAVWVDQATGQVGSMHTDLHGRGVDDWLVYCYRRC